MLSRDHQPRLRGTRRRRPARGLLRLPRTSLEPADAAAVPAAHQRLRTGPSPDRPSAQLLDQRARRAPGLPTPAGNPLKFSPHDFRRIFITDAIMHGHAAAHRPTHRRPPRHQRHHGLQGRLSRRSHQQPTARSSPAAAPSGPARNTAPRPTRSGTRSSPTSKAARSPSAPAAALSRHHASMNTAASGARFLRPTPPSGPDSSEIRDNLLRPHRRSRTRRLARRGRGAQCQPRRRRATSSPRSMPLAAGAAPPSTSACPRSPTSPAGSVTITAALPGRGHPVTPIASQLDQALRACARWHIRSRSRRRPAHRLRQLAAPRRLHCRIHTHRRQPRRRHHPDGRDRLGRCDHRAHAGELPCSSGERRMLLLAASIAAGTPVSLCDTLTGIDRRNILFLITPVLHSSSQAPEPQIPSSFLSSQNILPTPSVNYIYSSAYCCVTASSSRLTSKPPATSCLTAPISCSLLLLSYKDSPTCSITPLSRSTP